VLDCRCFRGLVNRDVKANDRLEAELTVPVNLVLFSGASIGGGEESSVGGGKPANVVRGNGDSDDPRTSMEWRVSLWAMCAIQRKNIPSAAEELSMEDEREPSSKVSSWDFATRAPLENREVPT